MSDSIIFLPIICCGKEMDDILVNDKRVMSKCSICGKTWRPIISQIDGYNFTVSYRIHVKNDDDLNEKTEEVRQSISELLELEVEALWKKILYGDDAPTTNESILKSIWIDDDHKDKYS